MGLFKSLSDDQFRHLGHIVWRWSRTEPPSGKHVKQLAALPRLRALVIDAKEEEVDQIDFFSNLDWNSGWSSDDVSHLTATNGLQDVAFFGPIARHEQILRSQMVRREPRGDHNEVTAGEGSGAAMLQCIDPMLT